MSTSIFSRRYWDFMIEQKVFALSLSSNGGSLIISERKRYVSFEMKVEVAAAVWMKAVLDEALVSGADGQFVRKFRGIDVVLIAERLENHRGIFMKFLQLRNGEVRNLYVPGGRSLWGWKKLAEGLDILVGGRSWKKEQSRTVQEVVRTENPLSSKDK